MPQTSKLDGQRKKWKILVQLSESELLLGKEWESTESWESSDPPSVCTKVVWGSEEEKHGVTERVEETYQPKRTRKRGVRTIITTHTSYSCNPATNKNFAFLKTKKKINETRCLGDREASQKSTGTEAKFLSWCGNNWHRADLTDTFPFPHLASHLGGEVERDSQVDRRVKWGSERFGADIEAQALGLPPQVTAYPRWVEQRLGTDF